MYRESRFRVGTEHDQGLSFSCVLFFWPYLVWQLHPQGSYVFGHLIDCRISEAAGFQGRQGIGLLPYVTASLYLPRALGFWTPCSTQGRDDHYLLWWLKCSCMWGGLLCPFVLQKLHGVDLDTRIKDGFFLKEGSEEGIYHHHFTDEKIETQWDYTSCSYNSNWPYD